MNNKEQVESTVMRPKVRMRYPNNLALAAKIALIEFGNGKGTQQDGLGMIIEAFVTARTDTMEAING